MKTLLLIDANSIIHRSFHALPPLTTPDGRPINAVYGLASILLKLWREERPDYAAALFDRPEQTFREKEYAEYKAQRPVTPDNLILQLTEAHNLFSAFGVKTFESPGYEADDLIATLAEKFRREKDLKIVVLTGDLDTLQLVEGDKVVVRTFKKGISDTSIYNESAVRVRYGLEPKQLIDYKALVGDPSDNIKGVPGVGPKTAAELLKRFGTLDGIYKNLNQDPKIEKRLAPFKKEAELARQLVTLEKKVPVEIGGVEGSEVGYNQSAVKEYFQKLGFDSLVERLAAGVKSEQAGLGLSAAPKADLKTGKRKGKSVANKILFIKWADEKAGGFTSSKTKVGFDLKTLLKNLWAKGKKLAPPYFDLGVAFWLIDPDLKNYSPPFLFQKFFKKIWSGSDEDFKLAFDFADLKFEEYKLTRVFDEIEMPLLPVLAEMENAGVGVSVEKLKKLESKIDAKIAELTQAIYESAGTEFNLNSPQQVGEIIFGKLGLGQGRYSRTGGGRRSTRAESLEEFKEEHKIVGLILDYRESFKIKSTYVAPLISLIGRDGRLHTEFIQTGTATGRLSSKSPNLQNIPQESIWAEELRSAFEAPPGFSLLSLDYSQLELRILAALSEDPKMISTFRGGLDIHRVTAAKVLGIPIGKVESEDRRLAKTLNFGLIYGMGTSAFAKASGLTRARAQEFVDAYFKEFGRVKKWQEEIRNKARTFGYVETQTGRRRYFFGLSAESPRLVAEAERAAVNHPVQGFGADIIKTSMIKTKEELAGLGSRGKNVKMILSIHDELLLEVGDDMIEKTARLVKKIMEGICNLSVPLVVEVSSGKDWGHLGKFSL